MKKMSLEQKKQIKTVTTNMSRPQRMCVPTCRIIPVSKWLVMVVALTTETNWVDPPTVQLLEVLAFQGKYKEAAEHYGRARAFHAAVEMCPRRKSSRRYTLENQHFEPPKNWCFVYRCFSILSSSFKYWSILIKAIEPN